MKLRGGTYRLQPSWVWCHKILYLRVNKPQNHLFMMKENVFGYEVVLQIRFGPTLEILVKSLVTSILHILV